MMFQLLAAVSLAAASVTSQQATSAAAERAAQYQQLYEQFGNPTLLWLIAEAEAEAGNRPAAIAALKQVVDGKLGFVVMPDSQLAQLAGDAHFYELAEQLERDFGYTCVGRLEATIDLAGLVSEGIAADRVTGSLYVGDMAGKRILRVRQGESPQLFALTGDLRPIGMKVDPSGAFLWVAATTAFVAADVPKSAILAFDLRTGALARTYSSGELKSVNDLAFAPNGHLYVTDSLGGSLFRLRGDTGKIERVTPAGKMGYPNGVAAGPDPGFVFVAQGIALRRIDTTTGEITTVSQPAGLALLSIDGLYWYDGSLVAVQNGGGPGRILRLNVSNDGSQIVSYDVLEAGHPQFDTPTTAAILADQLYVLANSQLEQLGDDGRIKNPASLKPAVVLRLSLTSDKDSAIAAESCERHLAQQPL